MKLHPESHINHVSANVVSYVLEFFKDKDEFFRETIELPEVFEMVNCDLYGPAAGDDPVPESEVFYMRRGDRPNMSRMVNRPKRLTRFITVIGGPYQGKPCVLYTVFGGPYALREPNDPTLKPEDVEVCKTFWKDHALVI